MITFKNISSADPLKLLTGHQVEFVDGKEDKYPVKKIVITIEAGEVATMMVERYVNSDDQIVGVSAKSENIKDGFGPTTFKNFYAVGAIDSNIELKVSGPYSPSR